MKTLAVVALSLTFAVLVSASVTILGTRTVENSPSQWQRGERAESLQRVTFVVALKQRNRDQLDSLFWAISTPGSPQYRQFMSQHDILGVVAPKPEHVQTVLGWLASNGVLSRDVKNLGDAIEVTTSVSIVETLMHTTLHEWTHVDTGKTIVRIFGSWGIDAEVLNAIEFVEGLLIFPVPHYTLKKPKTSAAQVTICPQSITTIYKVPAGTVSSGNTSICPAEWEDQYFNPDHLKNFAKNFEQKIAPLAANHIIGKNDPKKGGGESTLDIEYAAAIGAGATAWFWLEGNGAWLYTYATHVFNTTPAPLIFSISYGWAEDDQCAAGIGKKECEKLGVNSAQYVARVNTEFAKIGLRGISLFVASGDSGANGRSDPDCKSKILKPDFPAASPYVTSVGATEITTSSGVSNLPNPPPGCKKMKCASGGTEVAVSYGEAEFASGGGFSWVAAQPSYQAQAVATYLASGTPLPPATMYNAKGRGYPDVAAFGNQVLEEESTIQPVGGTSCSTPIVAGLWAILNGYVNQKTGKPLGFLNPLLYQMAAAQPTAFTDITVGNNRCTEDGCAKSCRGFECAKGWDPVTGLGTPVFSQMQAYIQKTIIDADQNKNVVE